MSTFILAMEDLHRPITTSLTSYSRIRDKTSSGVLPKFSDCTRST